MENQNSKMTTRKRVMLLGATGTVGKATARALVAEGFNVVCFGRSAPEHQVNLTTRQGDIKDISSIRAQGYRGEKFDVLVSCLASRNGDPQDAWAIDHKAHVNALTCAVEAGVTHVVLLSAICVQKPKLQFQFAKLAFEKHLIESGLIYSVVRPTALFKSLSGQIDRLKNGKPFLIFGDGALTSCKPISDGDLASYLVRCITDPTLHNRILPIGGPGPAVTPRQQGEMLFQIMGKPAQFKSVPIKLMDGIIFVLNAAGRFSKYCADKAEFARIGRYYATESMLVWDDAKQCYDAEATPETGQDTLAASYQTQIQSGVSIERGAHKVF